MNVTLQGFLYLIAAVLFIVGLKRLTSPVTARTGNRMASVGMLLAIVVTLLDAGIIGYGAVIAGLVVGGGIGAVLARRVEMTAMPQLVAAFNGFGGGASALVALSALATEPDSDTQTLITIGLSVLIGAVTFSGSFVAFAKLQGVLSGQSVTFPGQVVVDWLLAAAAVTGVVLLALDPSMTWAWALTGIALVLGVTRTLPIGGADMPVVISFLNSASGLAASAAGFVIGSNALIISGALVGAAGLILTNIMVKAMNRTLANVLFSVFGAGTGPEADDGTEKVTRRASADDAAVTLAYAERVIVVPGYGLAVAQAQHALRELASLLEAKGVEVRYAIHPVAGRMPGHMNVLLAEADVDYDLLFDLEAINGDFPRTDVALVVGANDVVNPSAREDESSPIYGMPILDVDKARSVIVIKRSLSPGFAGIDNPLFYNDNTLMFFADAKEGLADIVSAVKDL
ncbi:MAG TPA: NAD(P)(+) transhydrogenase (Re/Si-specific) subunit beta [Acidimicrobiia bacterium]|nr:NAD(P)(+) transhydrogenase (Re/Si-specific) subunit beta [Acidimicrobiia bacterium]